MEAKPSNSIYQKGLYMSQGYCCCTQVNQGLGLLKSFMAFMYIFQKLL